MIVSRLRGGRRLRDLPWRRIVLLGLPTAFVGLLLLLGIAYLATDIPPANRVATEQGPLLRYADGSELARIGTNRIQVPLSQISPPAQKAVLAAEDRGFYTEPGISPKGIARALFTNVRGGGGVQQGGSTITQQYAKNAFLSSERTYRRKVREVLLALKMTRERSKDQILEDYLNTIYFGRGAYGIEAASKAYFGPQASAATLTPAQAAVLASSIRSPAGYDPTRHPEAARDRWGYVLDGMVSQGWLDAPDRAAATYPPVVPPGTSTGTDVSGSLGHVVDAVKQELLVRSFAEDEIDGGGLEITTTLSRPAQEAAVSAVEAVDDGDRGDDALQGALVAVDPATGAVRAYYGGANGSGLDYAGGVVRPNGEPGVVHQPGSSFKPYVLATALSQGISLSTRFDGSSPQVLGGAPVKNFGAGDGTDYGRVDLVTATRNSINTVYFQLGLEVGPDKVAALAHAAGIPGDVSLVNRETGKTEGGIALGVYEVHVTDQAVGFATFAAGGQASQPYVVDKVVRRGQTVYSSRVEHRTAFSADVAADATYAMQQVVRGGSGTRAQLAGGRPAAGKTGTTNDSTNVWFSGFTPQLSAAVWFGYGDNRPVLNAAGDETTGGATSAGVWKAFMDAALRGQPVESFPPRAYVGSSTGGSSGPTDDAPAPTVTRRRTTAPPVSTATPTPTASDEPSASPSETAPTSTTRPPTATASEPAPTRTTTSPPTSAPAASAPAPGGTGGATGPSG